MSRENKVLADARAQFDSRFAKADRVMLYAEIIALLGAEQFTWKGLPDNGINSHCAERAINSGYAVAYYVPENISTACKGFTITPAKFVGVPDQNGVTELVETFGSDYALQLDLIKDKAVIIKNNDYLYSEYPNLMWFADMLARTDSSEKALIIWSKVHPIAKATSGIEGEQLKSVLKGIINDDDFFDIINDYSKTVNNGSPTSRDDAVLRLADENAVEKMHFLSEFHYELIRRYCTLYNIPFRTTSKSAQNLESELHNTDIFSKIMNANRLKCRQDAAKKINEVFGLNVSVDFSDLIKQENEVIQANIDEQKAAAETADSIDNNNVNTSENESELNNDEKTGDSAD